MGGGRSSSTSSGEDDGDADWKAAIYSVASTTTFNGSTPNGVDSTSNGSLKNSKSHDDRQVDKNEPQKLKHYQIKALKLLDDLLEKGIEIVRDPMPVPGNNTVKNEGGVKLFRDAPRGIVFDHVDELEGPRKRPRIIPGKEIDEKSKKFRRQLQSVAIEGTDIIAEARGAYQKRLAKLEAKDAAAKAAAKREEERIAELKKIRGERWLPSIAKYMKSSSGSTKEIDDSHQFGGGDGVSVGRGIGLHSDALGPAGAAVRHRV
ncbi:hypothetical protein LguiA_017650 [Lonicera macranthoides]